MAASDALVDDTTFDKLLLRKEDGMDVDAVNLPRTSEWTTNSRGQRLHLRSHWPSSEAKAAVVSLHGYGAHANRPTHAYVAAQLADSGIAYITLDFSGHGYSEGVRGLVEDPINLVDDVLSALAALFAPDLSGATSKVDRGLSGLPLFIMGHSMGGGTALLVSNVLKHGASASTPLPPAFASNRELFDSTIRPAFKGAILVCSVVDMGVSPVVQDWAVGTLAWWMPTWSVPAWIMNENDSNHLVWSSRKYRTYIHEDGFPHNPAGLSYGGNIRFRTLASALGVARFVQATLHQATFPFVVFHDEAGDIDVPAAGSAKLVAESPSKSKTLELMPGGLHDILANKIEPFTAKALSWIVSQIESL